MKARLEWIKYSAGRKPYSMRDVRSSLMRMGYEVQNDGSMIDYLIFEGTEESIILSRRIVTAQMRIVSPAIAQRFEVL